MPLPEIRASLQTAIDSIIPTYSPANPYSRFHGSVSHGQSYEDAVVTTSAPRLYTFKLTTPPTDSGLSTGGVLDYAQAELTLYVSYPVAGFTSLEELQDTMESDVLDVISAIRPVSVWDSVALNLTIGGLAGADLSPTVTEVSGTDGSEVVAYVNNFTIGVEYATGRT